VPCHAVEVALKARFCRSVHWTAFPSTTTEFNAYRSLRTHDLDILLHLSGREVWIREAHLPAWIDVTAWSAELRYTTAGSVPFADAQRMVDAVEKLLEVLSTATRWPSASASSRRACRRNAAGSSSSRYFCATALRTGGT
jgi:hypothetical protein